MNVKTFCFFLAIAAASQAAAQKPEATDSLQVELQEVMVKAPHGTTRLEGNTFVTSVAGTQLQNLGNALDVLAQLPMLKVEDGGVSVIGRNNPQVLIDGRPMRDGSELRQLLSSNIQKVEIIMAPGAMYGSDTGAVVKITTRRRFIEDLSLTNQASAKRGREWSATDFLDLSYRSGGWEGFLSGSFNHDNSRTKGITLNYLDYEGKPTCTGSTQRNEYPTNAGTVKAGVNHTKGEQSFGAYYRFNPEHADFSGDGHEWVEGETPVARNIGREISARSHRVSAYYDNTFAGKYLVHFDGDFRNSLSRTAAATTFPEAENQDVRSTDRKKSTFAAGKLYVSFPLLKGELTAGGEGSYTKTSLDYRMMNPDVESYIPSSLTDARQEAAALFASWSGSIGKMSVTAGLRYEYTDYDFKLDGKRDEDVSRRDHNLTPDISLGWAFGERSQLSLSYKASRVKPPYSQLTGSLVYTGPHQIEGGNPLLRDERMHNLMLSGSFGDFILQADFTRSLDTYAFVRRLYPAPTLQMLMQPVNINLSCVSAFAVWEKNIGAWTPSVTAGMFKQWLTLDGTARNRPIFSYYLDNTIALPHGWLLTANLSGRSKGDMHTNRFGSTWMTMDMSVGKTMLDKSLTVKLAATDIFNTANSDWTMNTFGIFVDKRQSYDRMALSLNVIYRFQPRRSNYKGNAASEAEMRRL